MCAQGNFVHMCVPRTWFTYMYHAVCSCVCPVYFLHLCVPHTLFTCLSFTYVQCTSFTCVAHTSFTSVHHALQSHVCTIHYSHVYVSCSSLIGAHGALWSCLSSSACLILLPIFLALPKQPLSTCCHDYIISSSVWTWRPHFVALDGLECALYTSLASKSWRSDCLHNAGTKSTYHTIQPPYHVYFHPKLHWAWDVCLKSE